MIGERGSQSVSAQWGRCGLGVSVGGVSLMVIGKWSEPVKGREASQSLTIGRRRRLAKAKSITDGQSLPTQENLLYSTGGLMRAKTACATFSKHGVEATLSGGGKERRGSERGLCMLR